MEKIKLFFTFKDDLFLISEDNTFLQLKDSIFTLSNDNTFPKISVNDKTLLFENKLVVISNSNVTLFSIIHDFKIEFSKEFNIEINIYDTLIIKNFIVLYFIDDTCMIINLKTLSLTQHSSSGLVFGTNGKYILEYDLIQKNVILFKKDNFEKKIAFEDFYINPATNEFEKIIIEKAYLYQKDNYILQSKYDYLYNLKIISNNILSQKVVLKNTFLGETVYVEDECYHITNKNIYKINWNSCEEELLLNWTETLGYNNYSGIAILQVFEGIIVFIATKVGVILFYSTVLNKILKHEALNKSFYTNTKSIIYKEEIFLNDFEGYIHKVQLPEL